MKKLIFLLLFLPFTLFGQITGQTVQDSIDAMKSPLGITNTKKTFTLVNQFITQADGYAQNAVPNTRQVIAGAGLVGGGNLTLDRTLSVAYGTTGSTSAIGNDFRINNGQTAYTWGNHAGLYPSVNTQIIAGTGLFGGGDFSANRTLNVTYGTVAGSATEGNDARVLNGQTAYGWGNHSGLYAPVGRLVSAGTGLNGGGSLGADRTLNVVYGTTAGTATEGNDARVSNGQTAYGWGNHSGLYVGKTGDETANGLKTWSNLATFSAGLGHSSHIIPATNLGSNIGSTSNAYANGFFATIHSNGGNLTFRNTSAVGATIFTDGNFRIGSNATNPSVKLQVDGASNLVGNTAITGTLSASGTATVTNLTDIYGGGGIHLIGSDTGNSSTRTNSTTKIARLATPHYTSSEEPACIFYMRSLASANILNIGGGTNTMNAATGIAFTTGATNTTVTGTSRLYMNESGHIIINDGSTSDGSSMLQVTGNSRLNGTTKLLGNAVSSQGASYRAYNTSDTTTNYERAKVAWSSNVFNIGTEAAGTGTARDLRISTGGVDRIKLSGTAGITGGVNLGYDQSSSGSVIGSNPTVTGTTGVNNLAILPTVTQSGAAVFRGIWVSPYITSKGLRAELLSLGTNSANGGQGTNTDKFVVYDNGLVYFGGAIKPKNYVPQSNEIFTDIAASVLINEEAEEEVIWTLPPVASQEDKVFTILNYANATTTITAAASNSFRNMNSSGSTVSSIVIPAFGVAEVFVKNSRYIVKYH